MADTLFQLLTFFMLSSGLAAFSILDLQAGAVPSSDAAANDAPAETPGAGAGAASTRSSPGPVAIWTVEAGVVRVRGQTYRLDQLEGLAQAIEAMGRDLRIVVVARTTASVADVVAVLEALGAVPLASVQISVEGA